MSVRPQRYYYRGLKGTPFSLGMALPEGYGHLRVVAETEIRRVVADHNTNGSFLCKYVYILVMPLFIGLSVYAPPVSAYFSGKNWKVHPDW